jgi:4-amino-4-deoxy-L-arabinose transferase-like glycosyltransferase
VDSLQKWSTRTVFDYDAKAFYLPHAKRLINEGLPFLFTEAAAQVPPLSYVFPALFGAELALQKQISIGLSVLVIFLLFRAGWVLHSRVAGFAAALLFAASRLFKNFLPTAGVEPLFIFLTAVWIWGLAEGWGRSRKWAFVIAGVAIGLASLTRATIVYFFPLMIMVSWWLARSSAADREKWRGVLTSHLIGLALVLPVLIKNIWLFNLPAVSTGAGIALFFGSNPLVWGFDQNYFSVGLDITSIIPLGASHLDVISDRRLMAVAKHMILTQDIGLAIQMCLLKLYAFLFVSDREWFGLVSEFRNYRILLFSLCLPILVRICSFPVAGIVVGLLAYQVVVHVPVLYAMRYSVVALDLGLVFLAGLGFAELVVRHRWLPLFVTLLAAWLLGQFLNRGDDRPPSPELNLDAVQSRTVLDWEPAKFRIAESSTVTQASPGVFVVNKSGDAVIDFDFTGVPSLLKLTSHVVEFDATVTPAGVASSCKNRLIYYYRKQRQTEFPPENALFGRWHMDGKPHRYFIGGYLNLEIYEPGTLRMRLSCEEGTIIQMGRIKIVEPNTGAIYRDQYFRSKGWSDWPAGF